MAKLSKYSYYPMHVDLFDGCERVRAMSFGEIGLYILCLNESWKTGSLADDIEQVALDIRKKVSEAKKLWPAVRACYIPHPEKQGRLINKKQEEIRAEVKAKSEKSKAAVETRWEKIRNRYPIDTDVSNPNTEIPTDVIPRAFSFSFPLNSSSRKNFEVDCDRLRVEYPREIDDEDMRHFLSYIETPDDQARFFANLPLHAAGWRAGYIPKAAKFLERGTWKVAPKADAKPAMPGAITESDLRRIEEEMRGAK